MSKKRKYTHTEPECFPAALRITPYAWNKIRYMNSLSQNELAGMGISNKQDLLLIEDFVIIKQTVTAGNCKFDDIAFADFVEDQVDLGRKLEQFCRIWIHSHPGNFGTCGPSLTDENTFEEAFGRCDWAVMLIVDKGTNYYARLSIKKGLKINFLMTLQLETDHKIQKLNNSWDAEFKNAVQEKQIKTTQRFFLDDDELIESKIPFHLHLPQDVEENFFIAYCNAFGIHNFNNFSQDKLIYWVKKYRDFMKRRVFVNGRQKYKQIRTTKRHNSRR